MIVLFIDAHTTAGLVCLAGLAIPISSAIVIWFIGKTIKAWWDKRKRRALDTC